MKNKIIISIYLIIVGTVVYFSYPIIKNRYFQSNDNAENQENTSSDKNKKSIFNNFTNNDDSDNDDFDDTSNESPIDDNVFIEVDSEDCEDNCEQFEDSDDKKYCQEYCGIASETETTNDCNKLAELEKDYCWKNKAINEKNFSFCKNIVDKKILESCKTQLTEDLINNSGAITD